MPKTGRAFTATVIRPFFRGVDTMSMTPTDLLQNGLTLVLRRLPLLCHRTRSCSSTAKIFPIGLRVNGSWWMAAWNL
jgi:hypothetical protein